MSDNLNQIIFSKKSFSDILKDIYNTSKTKERQISILIEELRPLIKTIGDATIIVPLIKEYMDVGVKNDEIIVKMAAIIQRAIQTKASTPDADFEITQQELDDLVEEYSKHTATTTNKNKTQDVRDEISGIKEIIAKNTKLEKDDNHTENTKQ